MATRFYLPASGTSPLTSLAFDSQWEQTGQAVRSPLTLKPTQTATTTLANSTAVTVPITTTQQILVAQFVSTEVFNPIRIDTSVLGYTVIRGLEAATTNNAHLAMRIRAVSPTSGAELGGVFLSSMASLTEFAATAATRLIGNSTSTIAATAVTISEPWRLVAEIGIHAQAPTAAGTATLRFGSSAATDFAFTSALTTDLNPWFELNINLDAIRFNNETGAKTASGISKGETVW